MTRRPRGPLTFVPDATAAAGALCVVAGVWWMYPPAGLALLGLVLLAVACLGAKSWAS